MQLYKKSDSIDDMIENISLYCSRPLLARYDVGIFLTMYSGLFFLLFSSTDKIFYFFILTIVLMGHLFVYMLMQWSPKFAVFVSKYPINKINGAEWVFVATTTGKDAIVKLKSHKGEYLSRFQSGTMVTSLFQYYFELQNIVYDYNSELDLFIRQVYPTFGKVNEFLSCAGHTKNTFMMSYIKWGLNDFDIPLPEFFDLYSEQLISPFFLFQVICLILWSLDDYWYYSFFTFAMLLFFEGMLCNQRQSSLINLRNMRRPVVSVNVYRDGQWNTTTTDEIVPGDMISLQLVGDVEDNFVPCDVVLINGSCVTNEAMLSGESTPQLKESLKFYSGDSNQTIDFGSQLVIDENLKRHVVFGGTKLISTSDLDAENSDSINSCVGIAIRTGFGTSQGSLVRKIMYAKENMNATNAETFYFIVLLVLFASVASFAVLADGLNDVDKNKFRLALHCIMIITSVVPPELPMELSLSITNSLAALSHSLIFCTEPHRIPYAGKVDVICCDKTGTLTQDKMRLLGISRPSEVTLEQVNTSSKAQQISMSDESSNVVVSSEQCSNLLLSGMGCCQTVFSSENGLVGDSLELEILKASGYSVEKTNLSHQSLINYELGLRIVIVRRFPFISSLRRMSVLVHIHNSSVSNPKQIGDMFVFVKGAPEVLESRLSIVPEFYSSSYNYHMSKGQRVLTLAYKTVESVDNSLSRDSIENDLIFLGFLIFDSDLKADSKSVVKELLVSGHKVTMITGDNELTAIDVSRRLGLLKTKVKSEKTKVLILQLIKEDMKYIWCRSENYYDARLKLSTAIDFNQHSIAKLSESYDLCLTGSIISSFVDDAEKLKSLCYSCIIFARMSPHEKSLVIKTLSKSGYFTLMCGDGTNDVGALQAAHIGVSIINDPNLESKLSKLKNPAEKRKGLSSTDRMHRAIAELQAQEEDPTIIKLGDASLASSFTARRTSIDSILTIIRQGRCTLVTTIQVYKILALNCLVSAYIMSILHISGLKQGDIQMTALGLVNAGLFFFLSRTQPIENLSTVKPPATIFSKAIMVSVFGQFFIHLICLSATMNTCEQYMVKEHASLIPDGHFQPTLVNTSIFLLSAVININNVVVNYRGHPFTQSFQQNTMLRNTILFLYSVIFICVGGQIVFLNDFLQMSIFPSSQFQAILILILIADFGLSYGIEQVSRNLEGK